MAEARLAACGLSGKMLANTLANEALTADLIAILDVVGVDACEKEIGMLFYELASKTKKQLAKSEGSLEFLATYVADGRVAKRHLGSAVKYLKKNGAGDAEAFETACGVGLSYTDEEITAAVLEEMTTVRDQVEAKRYHYNVGRHLGKISSKVLPFVEGGRVRAAIDALVLEWLGPRTAEDDKPLPKNKGKGKGKKGKGKKNDKSANLTAEERELAKAGFVAPAEKIHFPAPQENEQDDPALLEAHLAATGGRIVTRFPPEPNGFPHIGHAKSMGLNFGYARAKNGICYLRYDDTNPEVEKEEYFEAIRDAVEWLGHTPVAVTCASDYYQQMYDFAVQLIKQGDAYVCHQTKAEIEVSRQTRENSPWRDRPIEENLKWFEDMRKGKVDEGVATLRLKMDMQSDNPCMRDLIAYRVKFHAHPRSGDAWCLYPSYDFEHCIVDTLENITHSLCTLEFSRRRESYHWLLRKLGLYRPVVWEYSRLNVTHTVVSKRKLKALVVDGFVDGWDDPRMPTLMGLRRRGFTPKSINDFVDLVGVTRSENLISIQVLEFCLRRELNDIAPRRMVVLDPIPVTIVNMDPAETVNVECPVLPANPDAGTYTVPATATVYIERKDFRQEDSKSYYGLAPGKTVRLKYWGAVRCVDHAVDADGIPSAISVELVPENELSGKPKTIHWVSPAAPGAQPRRATVNLYDVLFKTPNVAEVENWRDDINENSKIVMRAVIDPNMDCSPEIHYQLERTAYAVTDMASSNENPIINRCCSLKVSAKNKV